MASKLLRLNHLTSGCMANLTIFHIYIFLDFINLIYKQMVNHI